MALLGPSARQQQSGRGSSFGDAAMSAGLGMQYHAASASSSHSHQVILAAAAAAAAHNQGLAQTTAAFYQANGHHAQQPQQQQAQHPGTGPGTNVQQPTQETQPDRPIGYGAFGVVW